MIIEAFFLAEHVFADIFNLLERVGIITGAEIFLIQRQKGLRHVKTVQPDLIGIDGFVPEVSLVCAGLSAQLVHLGFCSLAVFLFPGLLIELKEDPSLVDVIQGKFFRFVGADGSVFDNEITDKTIDKVKIGFITGYLSHCEQGSHHAAVDIIPAAGFAFPDFFDVPNRMVRRGLADQPLYIGVNLGIIHVCFFL